jgi:hypothetical protein
MKTKCIVLTAAFACCVATVSAQNEQRHEKQQRRGRHHNEEFAVPPVERLMQNFKETQPDEHKRLQTLRNEDPDAFRNEIRTLLRKARRQNLGCTGTPEHPSWRAGGSGQNERGGPPRQRNPEIRTLRQSIAKLSRSYQNTKEIEARKQIRSELKGELEKMFDLREAERLKIISQMEEKIRKIKRIMEERRSERDKIIKRQLKQMTGNKKRDNQKKSRKRQ